MQDCLLLDYYMVGNNMLKVQMRLKVPTEFGGYVTVQVMATPSMQGTEVWTSVLFFFPSQRKKFKVVQ